MNVLINIDEKDYKEIVNNEEIIKSKIIAATNGIKAQRAILNGTPIPDNATVGEVFCILACKEPICETASYFTIDKNLWNSPYQKGSK